MTEFLIRTVSRHPLRRLARPSAVLAFALVLAYGGGFWQTLLHSVAGATERNEPGLVAHWLRDATLSLPLVFCAVWAGVVLARRLIERNHGERSPVISAAVLAATVAWANSTVLGLASPLHNGLFGGHHGPDTFYLVHAGRDALLGLAANLPLAALVSAALLRTRPWAAPLVEAWRRPRTARQRFVLQGAMALLIVAPVAIVAQTSAQVATAGSSPGTPCPAGAPVKTFDVAAIDVDITLNRFGDHDPNGKMYVGVVHDPANPGKLDAKIAKVREAERTRFVSLGLKENDPIQTLVIRANLGDCVDINFTNKASGGDYGLHIDGLAFDVNSSSGDAIGRNASSAAANGETRHYRYWVPRDPQMEGAHYMRPGPGHRSQVAHGLFGALTVEPAGSKYYDMTTGEPVETGWQATVVPGNGRKAFREYNLVHHEVGTEKESILTRNGGVVPRVDPHTEAYRPGTRAMNYRSEPFMNRLDQAPPEDAHGYGSYTFGDPATPMPRGYLGDPTKIRILHAGSEVFHVYHLHGGSIRWRLNPHADGTYNYEQTGLDKSPKVQESASSRLDSQSFGPGESYDLEIEGGAGGLQQGAGEFLFHCHIGKHYVGGMWSFWRVFDTRQPDLKALPDRAPLPAPVSSAELIDLYSPASGRTLPDGSSLTKDNVDAWIRPQLPPQGTRLSVQDGSVWDWQVQDTAAGPLYLGEPADKSAWVDYTTASDRDRVDGHPSLMPGDKVFGAQDRPQILFNPTNGRPAFPLLRPQLGKRPPFAPNGHSGAPYLGENANQAKSTPPGVPDPWAGRKDGICPSTSPDPARTFNIVAIDVNTPITKAASDPKGKVYVLAKKKDAVLADPKLVEPLAIRANIGDCVAVTLTSELADANAFNGFSKINMHIHHVQFDTQASDGVISGMSFEQAIRPYKAEDVQLSAAAAAGDTTLKLTNPDPLRPERLQKLRPGVAIAIGQGTESIEVRQIETAAADGTITLTKPLSKDHAAGQWAGTEFVQSRWYPDVQLDNVFWHDHVDGIHTWGQGLVGQLIVEPKGSTYHDPVTGEQVDSGTYVAIHTTNPLARGLVEGAFRELALWQIDDNAVTDSTLNLRAEPWADRLAKNNDPSLLFSSYTHGDPNTPLPTAYLGDPFVVRTINVGPAVDSLHIDGHRFFFENRYLGPDGKVKSTPTDTLHYGVSERYTAILDGGAGGIQQQAGDYLYMNGVGRRFRQGAWGIVRVLPQQIPGLKELPDRVGKVPGPKPGDPPFSLPAPTGGRPGAAAADGGDPCPANAPVRNLSVSAVDLPGGVAGRTAAFVPSDIADQAISGAVTPQPLVAHVAAGECLTVAFHNRRATARASFHVNELTKTIDSSGVNVGFNPEQTVAPGAQRTYRFYADTRKVGSAAISDFGGNDSGTDGLYGAVVVAPAQATFTHPESGAPVQFGSSVDVHVPGTQGYRDFTAIMADDDPIIGGNFMPYPDAVAGPAMINYRTEVRPDDANMFNSRVYGDPATPLFRAYGGDPTKVHFLVAPGSEQAHVFNVGGHHWLFDPEVAQSQLVQNQGIAPGQAFDAELEGGAGGLMRAVGDYYYGDMRRPFTQAGMWGLMRVMSDPSCPIKPLDGGLGCAAQSSVIFDPPSDPVRPGEPAPGDFLGGGGELTAAPAAAPAPVAAQRNRTPAGPRGLRVRGRVALSEFATRGMRIELLTPRDSRLLDLRLMRVSGKRLVAVVNGRVRLKRGGPISLRWKPGRNVVSTLRSGTYVLRVRVGPDAQRLSRQRDEVTVRLTGRAPRATSTRRR